jgi:hypothetical protein
MCRLLRNIAYIGRRCYVIMEQSWNRDLEGKPEEIRRQIYANATSSTTNLTLSHRIMKSRRRDRRRKPASNSYGSTISRSGNNFLSYVLSFEHKIRTSLNIYGECEVFIVNCKRYGPNSTSKI